LEVQLNRTRGVRPPDLQRRMIVTVVAAAIVLVGVSGAAGIRIWSASVAKPLPGAVKVHAVPLPTAAPTVGPGTEVTPLALPDHMLLQVPFTTQAPLNNWAQHQESCEAANLTMLYYYWTNHSEVVIDPHAADNLIHQIDGWKPQPDLTDMMVGQLAEQHFGYSYRILPNTPEVIAQQLSAGRPLLAEVRTHGLGNPHYPGYSSHYEQTGWSVPHFVTIIGYDSSGVWLNDPGISWGRGYHITYAQLAHAIDDLDQHHPNLAQGQVLLLIAPDATPKIRTGSF
jgi:hypothetical protein